MNAIDPQRCSSCGCKSYFLVCGQCDACAELTIQRLTDQLEIARQDAKAECQSKFFNLLLSYLAAERLSDDTSKEVVDVLNRLLDDVERTSIT